MFSGRRNSSAVIHEDTMSDGVTQSMLTKDFIGLSDIPYFDHVLTRWTDEQRFRPISPVELGDGGCLCAA